MKDSKHNMSFIDKKALSPLAFFEKPLEPPREQTMKNRPKDSGSPLLDPNYKRQKEKNAASQNSPTNRMNSLTKKAKEAHQARPGDINSFYHQLEQMSSLNPVEKQFQLQELKERIANYNELHKTISNT